MFRKVLIANRGEIAVRIIRALRERGIRSVAVFSDADRGSLHVRLSDEAAHIGPAPASESYLNVERIVAAAQRHGVDAIHPGYGFQSENAGFASACKAAGIQFIGPGAESIRAMGSKTEARRLAIAAGVPVTPGSTEAVEDPDAAREIARQIGYPVLVKAAAGGGGKGMRIVRAEPDLQSALRDASSEAARSFHNGDVYLEKFIDRPRHVEIQVLGDEHGRLIHLNERECSIQRRHQKVIEESPSPVMDRFPGLRERMGEAAVRAAKAAGYTNAGTVEFLVAGDGSFYFLEMNTRLQVEHPVTELVTGIDLVDWQLRIAAGERLTLRQEDIVARGHAMECRIYAEDPENQFFPSPGRIERWTPPGGPGVRLDEGVYTGWTVPLDYDPLLAKLAVWGESRERSISRMQRALGEMHVDGIRTNVAFFSEVLADETFCRGDLHTGFLEDFFGRRSAPVASKEAELIAALVTAANHSAGVRNRPERRSMSRWLSQGRAGLLR